MASIRLTTRCQMTCAHCCFSCTEQGEDMPYDVFKLALDLATDYGESISLSGGEPTLHPHFWHMLIDCISHKNIGEGMVWLATNGANTEIALKLAQLAKKGVVAVDLSLDRYHDPIDTEVIEAFTENLTRDKDGFYLRQTVSWGDAPSNDLRGVRHSFNPSRTGRARMLTEAKENHCVCDTFLFQPNGDIFACGCDDSPKIGDVWTGFEPLRDEDGDYHYGCHRKVSVCDENVA